MAKIELQTEMDKLLLKNQAAINDFFEGYGRDTIKEYGQTILDLQMVLKQNKILTDEFEEDLSSKFNSLYKLVSNIYPEQEKDFSKN